MSAPVRALLTAALLALAALSAGCTKDNGSAGIACNSNLDCTLPGTRCDEVRSICVCASDEACDEDQFCNRSGVCQAVSGCTINVDCTRDGTYCDLGTGQCLEGPPLLLNSPCGLASHCPLSTICETGACVPGCFDDGDCVLGEVCFDGLCASGTGLCSSDGFCGYGERCRGNQCSQDRRGPYCRGCTQRTGANPEPCDEPRNFCLINSLEAGGFSQFCGVDCSLGQACPNGYQCSGVVILTESVCTFTAQCQCDPRNISFASATCRIPSVCDPRLPDGTQDPNATACVIDGEPGCNGGQAGGEASCIVPVGQVEGNCTCATDLDCDGGAACVSGVCCTGPVREDRQCAVGENRVSGFCTCATDDDCPRDVCDGSRGACAISGLPCTPGADDCGPIPCVNGGCLIGQNCAPLQGLSCSIVTGQGG